MPPTPFIIYLFGPSRQWIDEVIHFCTTVPVILVGCKKDLQRDPRVIKEMGKRGEAMVTPEEARVILIVPHDGR